MKPHPPLRILIDYDGSVRLEGASAPAKDGSTEWSLASGGLKSALQATGEQPFELVLRFSNRCPHRCRMCGPRESSRWASDWPALERTGREFYRRGASWPGADPAVLSSDASAVLFGANWPWERVSALEIEGGEPFAEPTAWAFLERALDSGGQACTLRLKTSAIGLESGPGRSRLETAGRFARLEAKASAEATGDLYRYVRGQSFEEFERGFEALRGLPSARVSIACSVSAYTVFGVSDLWAWNQERGAAASAFEIAVVERPRFLAPSVLPIETRTRALQRLRDVGADGAEAAELVRELARDERSEDETRIQAFQEFIEFSADLDRMRGEQLALAVPEILRLEEPLAARRGLAWPQRRGR